MKGKIYKKGLAVLLGLTLAANVPLSRPLPFHMLDSYAYTGTATVKASSLNVRSDAGTGYSAVARLAAGASVRITGEKTGTDGKTWYQIQYKPAQAMFLLPTYASRFRIPQMQILKLI